MCINHKGYLLLESVIALMIISAFFTLMSVYDIQRKVLEDTLEETLIGLYFAEHIQSMILLDELSCDMGTCTYHMNTYGYIDPLGRYTLHINQQYLTLYLKDKIIFEGWI